MSRQFITRDEQLQAHKSDIYALVTTDKYTISASGDNDIKVWHQDGSKNEADTPVDDYARYELAATLDNTIHKAGIHHLSVSLDGNMLASAGFGGEIVVWDLETLTIVNSIENVSIWAIALSPTGKEIAATTIDGKIIIYSSTSSENIIGEFETKGSFPTTVAYSSDGLNIATGHENGNIFIFDIKTTRLIHSLTGIVKPVRCIKFSPGNTLLSACGDNNLIFLYSVKSGNQLSILSGHTSWIFYIDWNLTGEYLSSCDYKGKVRIWNIQNLQTISTIDENDGPVFAIAWSKLSNSIATAGADCAIRWFREAS